jgi:hypothetical protein
VSYSIIIWSKRVLSERFWRGDFEEIKSSYFKKLMYNSSITPLYRVKVKVGFSPKGVSVADGWIEGERSIADGSKENVPSPMGGSMDGRLVGCGPGC